MSSQFAMSAVSFIIIIAGVVLWMFIAGRKRSERLQDHLGLEHERTVHNLGDEGKAQTELVE
jgi:hypothetical protein